MLGEELGCIREGDNSSDPYAVAVMRVSAVVGHTQRRTSSVFLQKDGSSISGKVTGPMRYSSGLLQGGLEVPRLGRTRSSFFWKYFSRAISLRQQPQ